MSRDPASGTAIQEINFWLSMERALEKIDEQLKSDQISKLSFVERIYSQTNAKFNFTE